MSQDPNKTELIAELARARARIAANWGGLREDLDFQKRAKQAIARRPAQWIGGAAFLGLVLSRLRPRARKVVVGRKNKDAANTAIESAGKAGLLLGILKMVLDLLRPALTAWATKRISEYSAARWQTGPARR